MIMSTMMLNDVYVTYMMHVFQSMLPTKIFYSTYFTCGQVRNDPTTHCNSQQKPAHTSWDEKE